MLLTSLSLPHFMFKLYMKKNSSIKTKPKSFKLEIKDKKDKIKNDKNHEELVN